MPELVSRMKFQRHCEFKSHSWKFLFGLATIAKTICVPQSSCLIERYIFVVLSRITIAMDVIRDEQERNNVDHNIMLLVREFARQNTLNHVVSLYHDDVRPASVYTHMKPFNFGRVWR